MVEMRANEFLEGDLALLLVVDDNTASQAFGGA